MKHLISRLERRLIKAKLARSQPAALIAQGEKRLLAVFKRAAKHSLAYQTLLAEAGVRLADIRTLGDVLLHAPILNKANTFQRFNVRQLLRDHIVADDLASVLTSSGHGGNGFALGLSTRQQARNAAWSIDLGLELAFGVDQRRTLLVNCLPMGVTFSSEAVCVANVSVREDMACAVIQQTDELFEQIILCGDPLFLKRLCDYSQEIGLDWRRYRMHVILGEETFPETFRDYLAQVLGNNPDSLESGLIGSSMGVGELGLNLFNETRETVALRRACIRHPALLKQLTGIDLTVSPSATARSAFSAWPPGSAVASPAPTFMVYNPLRTVIEVVNADAQGIGDLLVSVLDNQTPIPLIRYATGDRMQHIAPDAVVGAARDLGLDLPLPTLPMVALHGRIKDILPGGGHIDLFKEALYQHSHVAQKMSGAHQLVMAADGLHWQVQVNKGVTPDRQQLEAWHAALHSCLTSKIPNQKLTIEIALYEDFSPGKGIDYERKFVYWLDNQTEVNPA